MNVIDDKDRHVVVSFLRKKDRWIIIIMYCNIVFDYYCMSPKEFNEDK